MFCYCGNRTKFFRLDKGYKTYCSAKCRANDPKHQEYCRNLYKEKTGYDHPLKNPEVRKQIKDYMNEIEENGKTRYENTAIKTQEKLLKERGVKCSFQLSECRQHLKEFFQDKQKVAERTKKSKAKKKLLYGNENYNNGEQRIKTCNEKYNCDYTFQTENNKTKSKAKKKLLYGDENYNNPEKAKVTCNKNWGVDNYTKTKQYKDYMQIPSVKISRVNKVNKTKKKNGTFKSSNCEDIIYQFLIYKFNEDFDNVLYQYNKDKRYPFMCDFYIKSLDLFIEINFDPSHGFEPFNSENPKHLERIKQLKEKSKEYTLKYNKRSRYDNFIEVWTKRDVIKFQFAKQNNLNYLTFYNWDQFYEWFSQL